MRIGVCCFGLQTGSRERGIGRYLRGWLRALLAAPAAAGHQVLRFGFSELARDQIEGIAGPDGCRFLGGPGAYSARMEQLVRANPEQLDVLIVGSPCEPDTAWLPPPVVAGGPQLIAIVYDLIPLLFPTYRANSEVARCYQIALDRLRSYDQLWAISQHTRLDVARFLRTRPGQARYLGAASDLPQPAERSAAATAALLAQHRVPAQFVLTVASLEERKNLDSLLHAYALVPTTWRRQYQLVVAGLAGQQERQAVQARAATLGLGGTVQLLGRVSDELLSALYTHCTVFISPSRYEGFGLPLLEAMQHGAAVIAGNNSSQPEVVGTAGRLVNADDSAALSRALSTLLGDPAQVRLLGDRARQRSRAFSWELVGKRSWALLAAGSDHEHDSDPEPAGAAALAHHL